MKTLSEKVPCLLFIQIQIQTVCHVYFRGKNVPVVKGLLSAGLKSNGFELNPMFEFCSFRSRSKQCAMCILGGKYTCCKRAVIRWPQK